MRKIPDGDAASAPVSSPAPAGIVFDRDELRAVRHALSASMPGEMYAAGVSAWRKVEAAIAGAERPSEHISKPIARVLAGLAQKVTR